MNLVPNLDPQIFIVDIKSAPPKASQSLLKPVKRLRVLFSCRQSNVCKHARRERYKRVFFSSTGIKFIHVQELGLIIQRSSFDTVCENGTDGGSNMEIAPQKATLPSLDAQCTQFRIKDFVLFFHSKKG